MPEYVPRQADAFRHLRAGPVIVDGVHYGNLQYVPDRGWLFTPELKGLRSRLTFKSHPQMALPVQVQSAILDALAECEAI